MAVSKYNVLSVNVMCVKYDGEKKIICQGHDLAASETYGRNLFVHQFACSTLYELTSALWTQRHVNFLPQGGRQLSHPDAPDEWDERLNECVHPESGCHFVFGDGSGRLKYCENDRTL